MEGLHHAAQGIGQQEDGPAAALAELPLDDGEKRVDPLPRFRGDGHIVRAHGQGFGGHEISLVPAADHRGLGIGQLADELVHHLDVGLPVRIGGVNDVDQQVGVAQLLQGGPEGVHQMVGQLRDEANRVGQEHRQPIRDLELAGGGVQGVEKPVVGRDVGPGQAVQQGGFARVRIAHQSHHGDLVFLTAAAFHGPEPPHLLQLFFQPVDAGADMAAVRFQFGLAGAPGADAAAETGQGLAHARELGKQILVLGQLHLQAAFGSAGALGEDVQDQSGAVQDRGPGDLLQGPDLAGRQVVVEDHHLRPVLGGQLLDFLGFALSYEAVGIRGVAVLQDLGDANAAGGLQQGLQLVQGGLGGLFLFFEAVGG